MREFVIVFVTVDAALVRRELARFDNSQNVKT
jgi:hypothetical protein